MSILSTNVDKKLIEIEFSIGNRKTPFLAILSAFGDCKERFLLLPTQYVYQYCTKFLHC